MYDIQILPINSLPAARLYVTLKPEDPYYLYSLLVSNTTSIHTAVPLLSADIDLQQICHQKYRSTYDINTLPINRHVGMYVALKPVDLTIRIH